jgi:hypothetical protein
MRLAEKLDWKGLNKQYRCTLEVTGPKERSALHPAARRGGVMTWHWREPHRHDVFVGDSCKTRVRGGSMEKYSPEGT